MSTYKEQLHQWQESNKNTIKSDCPTCNGKGYIVTGASSLGLFATLSECPECFKGKEGGE